MQSNLKILYMVLVCWLVVLPLTAQPLTLDSCISLALRNNAELVNANLEVEKAKEVKKQVFTKYFPQVSLNAGAYHALNPLIDLGIDDISNTNVRDLLNVLYDLFGSAVGFDRNVQFFEHGVVAGAGAVQPVYMGGQIVNGNRLAKVGVQAAECKSQLTRDEVEMQTAESYYLLLSLREKKRTIDEVQMLLDTLYKDVTVARAAGLITDGDVLKVKLKMSELQSARIKVDNGMVLATMALCQSIGLPYSEDIEVSEELDLPQSNPLHNRESIQQTASRRTEYQLLELGDQAERLKEKMLVGETLPHVLFGGMYGYSNLFDRNDHNGLLFATVQIPLTGWWETSHKIKEQRIVRQEYHNKRQDLEEKMVLQTQQAYNTLIESHKQYLIAQENVGTAKEHLRQVRSNYNAGLVSLTELLEAQVIYRQAIDQQGDDRIAYAVAVVKFRQYSKQ